MHNTPKNLDIIWIKVEPHSGKEVGGHDQRHPCRTALVLSTDQYNKIGMVECMPITSHNHMKKPFNSMLIPLKTEYNQVHGFIITFEVLCYDYLTRDGKIVDHLDISEWPTIENYLHHIFYS